MASALKEHRLSTRFPAMTEDEFQGLKERIAASGFNPKFPVILYEGQILDGRHRNRACIELGIEPLTEVLPDDQSPVEFVIQANLIGRNLNEGQRAILAAEFKPSIEKEARDRQRAAGGDHRAKSASVTSNGSAFRKGEARQQAGRLFGVSGSSVTYAQAVIDSGCPELIDALKKGDIGARPASRIAKEGDHTLQRSVLAARNESKDSRKKPAAKDEKSTEANPVKKQYAYAALESIEEAIRLAHEARKCARRAAKQVGGAYIKVDTVSALIREFLSLLESWSPHGPCPECGGSKCTECLQRGYVCKPNKPKKKD